MGAWVRKGTAAVAVVILITVFWRKFSQERAETLAFEDSAEDAAQMPQTSTFPKRHREGKATLPRLRLSSGLSPVDLERGQALDYKRLKIAEHRHKRDELARFLGRPLKSGGLSYYVLSRHGAVVDASKIPADVEWSKKRGGYWVFRGPTADSQGSGALSNEEDVKAALPVVINPSTGRMGIVTGQILLTPRKMADLSAIVQDQGLELVQRFDHLSFASLKPRSNDRIFEKFERLQGDPRVKDVELDILENEVSTGMKR